MTLSMNILKGCVNIFDFSFIQLKLIEYFCSLISIVKLAQSTLVDLIDLFHDLTKFIPKRNESTFANNENQPGHQTDKVYYTVKGWSLVGKV